MVAERSGHHVQLEEPDRVVRAVRDVLEAVPRRARPR
jgi:pimeloyl-ACP methyl ester carboxylesterase